MNIIKKYRLQSEMESLKVGNEDWFKDYLRQILESDDREVYAKTDYISYSIQQLTNQISYISNEIKELQVMKKNLSTAKEFALELTASVFQEYGIEKLEGVSVSSLTITPEKSKTSESVCIDDEKAVMGLGYVKFEPDTESILKAMTTDMGKKELEQFVSIVTDTIITPAKVKINTKRATNNTSITTDELLQLKQAS